LKNSLFVLIFQVSKIIEKIENRKRTAVISHQKILIIAKKKSNLLVQIIIASYYRIVLSLRNNYRKMSSMRCDCHPC